MSMVQKQVLGICIHLMLQAHEQTQAHISVEDGLASSGITQASQI